MSKRIGSITLNDYDRLWKKHGYVTARIDYKGKPTRYRGVFKDTELIFIPSKRYKLLPHEVVLEALDRLVKEGELTPISISNGTLGGTRRNIFYVAPIEGVTDWGKQMYASFKYRERRLNGEDVVIGAAVFNSVDGTLRLGVRSFAHWPKSGTTIFFRNVNRATLLATYHGKHLASLEVDPERLAELVKKVMEGADTLLPVFRQWKKERLTEAVANEVLKRLPTKYVKPYVETIDDSHGTPTATLDTKSTLSLWDFYQGVSEAIWHGVRAKFKTRLLLFDKLHEALMSRQFFDFLVD